LASRNIRTRSARHPICCAFTGHCCFGGIDEHAASGWKLLSLSRSRSPRHRGFAQEVQGWKPNASGASVVRVTSPVSSMRLVLIWISAYIVTMAHATEWEVAPTGIVGGPTPLSAVWRKRVGEISRRRSLILGNHLSSGLMTTAPKPRSTALCAREDSFDLSGTKER
jgi:hypothetical protein